MRLKITIESFAPCCKNTLRGFCLVKIEELHLLIHDVAIYTKYGATWAQLPMRLWVKNGHTVVDSDGRPKYFPILGFTNTAVSDAFSAAVIALLERDPRALECRRAP